MNQKQFLYRTSMIFLLNKDENSNVAMETCVLLIKRLICIPGISYPNNFSWFVSVTPAKYRDSNSITQQRIPSKSFPINDSSIILPLDNIEPETLGGGGCGGVIETQQKM
jgi:hypothetical protein